MRYPLLSVLAFAASLAGCQTMDERPSERVGVAALWFADGSPAGTARLIGSGGRIDISVALDGMLPGQHRLRLHRTGICTPPDYRSAGDPFESGSAMSSDLPNAIINQSGSGTVSATLAGDREELLARIFDADGTTLVLYEGQEGNTRVACGVFTQS